MGLLYMDPFKLTLKEVEEVIYCYGLESSLGDLLAELARMDYEGYIRLSKPRDVYSQLDWKNVLEVLQKTINEAKAQNSAEPLPEFLEKKLGKILKKADFSAFQVFVEVNSAYLPDELVRDRNNLKFLKWLFARLRDETLVLFRHQIRLGENAEPEDLVY